MRLYQEFLSDVKKRLLAPARISLALTSSIVSGEVASLHHEVGNDTMELSVLVAHRLAGDS